MIDIPQHFLTLVSCVISSPTEGVNFLSFCHSTKYCQLQISSCFPAIMKASQRRLELLNVSYFKVNIFLDKIYHQELI